MSTKSKLYTKYIKPSEKRALSDVDVWLKNNNRIKKNVSGILIQHKSMTYSRKETLYKSWVALVYKPLDELVKEKANSIDKDVDKARFMNHQAFLDYSSDPYAVLTLDGGSNEKYDPFVATRDRDLGITYKTLKDPLNLAAREKSEERMLMDPDWPVPARPHPRIANSFDNSQIKTGKDSVKNSDVY